MLLYFAINFSKFVAMAGQCSLQCTKNNKRVRQVYAELLYLTLELGIDCELTF